MILRNANFRRLWLSQLAVAVGDAVMRMGLLELFRAHEFNKEREMARAMFAVALPGVLLGPVAMAVLDRWQRRRVLWVNDLLRAAGVIAIAVWLWPLLAGRVSEGELMVVYGLIFAIGCFATFYIPARSALLPHLVGPEELAKANTIFASSLAVAAVGGQAVGGFVAERWGVQWAILANVAGSVLSVWWVLRIKMPAHATSASRPEWREGWRYLREHPTALPLVLLSGAAAFVLGILVVKFVGYAMDTLGLRTGGVGYLVAAGGAGAAAGMLVVGANRPWTRAGWLPFAQLLVAGGVLVGLSWTTRPWGAVPQVFVLGAVVATLMIQIDTRLQAQVAELRRGAVFAARGMLTSLMMVVAFWLQFGTEWLQQMPAPVVFRWLGAGAALVALAAYGFRRR